MATDMDQDEALAPDESLDTGFDGATDSDESEKPDPVAELRAEFVALRESVSGLNPAQITSELGRIRTLQSKIDRLESAPAPQRDTLAEDAIASMARVLVASPLIEDEAKSDIRALLSRLGDAQTKSERERLKRELLDEMKPAVESPKEEAQTVSPEAASATARVLGYADGLGLTDEETATVLNGKWQVTQADGNLEGAVKRLKGVLKAHVENKGTVNRVTERKQAAGSGSPQRSGGTLTITDMSDADDAYARGEITHAQYVEYRKNLGMSLVPGGGR